MPAPGGLVDRYGPDDLKVFTDEERARFVHGESWDQAGPAVAWELLYRLEPELYERLTAGERLHPAILDWLPGRIEWCVEVAAGAGRLTSELAPRCSRLTAVEPCAPMRSRLEARELDGVDVVEGFFDAIPVEDGRADLVVTCAALQSNPDHGGEAGLREMERVCAPGGLVVVVWPPDRGWLAGRGYRYLSFPGDMAVEFGSLAEAVDLARIFYPDAARRIWELGERRVPYEVLGINAPRDLCWKRPGVNPAAD